jgi:beta-glucosidase
MVYNERPSDTFRKYPHDANLPLYPFGYGLSYTKFSYEICSVSQNVQIGDKVNCVFNVTNTGNMCGDEVIIIYARDLYASVTRPVKEVIWFDRVTLKPGETREMNVTFEADTFGLYNAEMRRVIEPGKFALTIGPHTVHFEIVM